MIRRLLRNERGVSVVEFAFVAPVLAVFIVAISDFGRAFAAKLTLEQAAYRALEKAQVGTVSSDYATLLKPEAAAGAGVAETNVTVTNWLECDGTRQASFDGDCTDTQQTARYVQLTITDNFRPSFSYGKLFLKADANGNVPISSTASLRVQ